MKYVVRGSEFVKDLEPSGDRPALAVWRLSLEDPSGTLETAELVGRPDNEPKQGELIEGDIEDGQFGKRFKRARKGGFGGGGGRSPEEKRRIERMAAHKSAVALVGVAANLGLLKDISDSKMLFQTVSTLADWLEADLP